MLTQELQQFAGKRVLLLQGPTGLFFARLARDLRRTGAQVVKVNFNAGDWFFYPRGALNYRGTPQDWPVWLEALIVRSHIDAVLLFGDCRPIHRAAHDIASQHGLDIGVFEEGYVRPDYITFERFGVNGHSKLSLQKNSFKKKLPTPKNREVGSAYWHMIFYTVCYFFFGALGKPWFRHYQHHRPLTLLESFPWLRSVWRKQWYRWTERGVQVQLTTQDELRFFLVPLQVFNDAQITEHSHFEGVAQFIETTLHSFVQHAPADAWLVFKHHPMDRGHKDYTALIKRLAQQADAAPRIRYIHDQHLPSLLNHASGVVVVNSTVGLSALHHGAPTKVCGNALYDLPGLTWQGSLDDFWCAAPTAKPDRGLYQRFRQHLITNTQLNGSFYKPMKLAGSCTGLVWGVGQSPRKLTLVASNQRNTSHVPHTFPIQEPLQVGRGK